MTIGALHCRSIDFVTMPETSPNPGAPAEPAEPAEATEAGTTDAPAIATSPLPESVTEPAVASDAVEEAAATTESAATPAPAAQAAPPIADLSPAACAALLAEHFPALFGPARMLPIKLRIQADIQQRAPGLFNKKSLSIFLHRYTTGTAYIKALLNSAQRFDLDGQGAGEIAQEHRDAANTEMARRLAIVQARRTAEREALRKTQRPDAAAATPLQAPALPSTDQAPRADRLPRPPRPPRPPGPPGPPRADRAPTTPRPTQGHVRPPRAQSSASEPAPAALPTPLAAAMPSMPLTPEQVALNEARRSRAALLRTFEGSTLTRANFCALKGITDAALELQLVQARQERKLLPPPPVPQRDPLIESGIFKGSRRR